MSKVGDETNPISQTIFQVMVPLLLGGILTYLISISSAQSEQGKSIYVIQGQLSAISQQNTDANIRMNKIERREDDLDKTNDSLGNRLTAVENKRGMVP